MDLQKYQHRFERLKEQAHSNKKDLFFYEAFKKSAQNIINHALNNGFPLVSIKWLIACILSMLSRGMFGPDIPQEERVTDFIPDIDDDTVDLEHLSATFKVNGPGRGSSSPVNQNLDPQGRGLSSSVHNPSHGRGHPSPKNQNLTQQGRGHPSPSIPAHPQPQRLAISRPSNWVNGIYQADAEEFLVPPGGQSLDLGAGPAISSRSKTSDEFIHDTYNFNFGSVTSYSFPLPKCVMYNDHIAPIAEQLSLTLGVKFTKTFSPHALTIHLAEYRLGGFNAPARNLVAFENFYRALLFLSQWFDTINTKNNIPPLSTFLHDLRLSEVKDRIEACGKILPPVMARLGNKNYCQTFVPTVKTLLDPTDPYYSKRKTTERHAAAQGTEPVNKPSNPSAAAQNTQAANTTKINPASTTSSAPAESAELQPWKICHRKLWEGICLLDDYNLPFHNKYDLDTLDQVYTHHLRLLSNKKPTPGKPILWSLKANLTLKIEERKFNKTHWKLGNHIINVMCKSLFDAEEDDAWQALEASNTQFAKDLATREREEGWVGLFIESW